MDLKIFDVEHGACALLACDNNTHFMVDCGHNQSTGWYPGDYLRRQGISRLEALGITNYDEDHASGLPNLLDKVSVQWLFRNMSVSSRMIRRLKSYDGMGPGIDHLVHAIDYVFTGDGSAAQPWFQGLEWQMFSNSPDQFDDENNLSAILHFKCNGVGVMFPGDIERAGLLELLKRESFRQALRDTAVLVAPHHGRDSGCCAEVFHYMEPFYVVISDKGYMYDTQQTIQFYRQYTRGGPFRDETRRVLTTRRDGRIGFNFFQNSWGPY